jgi:hypothetical protein
MASIRRYGLPVISLLGLLLHTPPALSATLQISVNYAHDWVSGVTDPAVEVSITVTDNIGAAKATGTATADGTGYFLVAGDNWSPMAPDLVPGDRVYAAVSGATAAVDPIGSITAELDADSDVVNGSINAPGISPPVTVRCAIWEEPTPPNPIDVTADLSTGDFTCDFGADRGWDLVTHQMVAVMYWEADGDQVINVPPWTWMRVDYGGDEVGGDHTAGITFDLTVKDSGGSAKATAQVVSAANQGWQGDGFFTQPGDWDPAPPDILPGDEVFFSGGDGTHAQVRVGVINGNVNPAADLVSGFISLPWLPADTLLDVECHPWGAWGLGIDASILSSTADADTDPGYGCDWSTEPWDMVDYQPVGVVYYNPDGNGVIRVIGDPPGGAIFIDSFESGNTSMWSTSVP